MKIFKKILAVSCTVLLFSSLISCKDENNDYIVYGKVTSINGNTITLSLGEMEGFQGKDKKNGEKPDGNPPENMKDGDMPKDMENGNPPSRPDGENQTASPDMENKTPPDISEGDFKGGMPGGMGGFTENGETLELTIEDESLIKVVSMNDTEEGSLDNIDENSILIVEYTNKKKEKIKSITVESFGMGGPRGIDKTNETE